VAFFELSLSFFRIVRSYKNTNTTKTA